MDNLTYTYVGNRLTAVTDAVTAATSYPNDFQNGSNPIIEADYMYDANGNLIFDDNKGISSITYNLLNLPEQVILSNGKKTVYTYDAFGTKLKKQEYTGTTLTLTSDYLGSVQYLNGTAQFAATGEGRVYNNSGTYRYDYFMKDQVGNIRLTYTANGSNVTILQRDEYYPFGNTFDSYTSSAGPNPYKFNSMEYQENGLNTFDFHARMYDPQIGRSFQPDPAADMFAFKSPYAFLANNPVMYTDPTGMQDEIAPDFGDGDGWFGSISPGVSTVPGAWFLHGGGYTQTSQKWMGIVYVKETNTYYYKGREVSSSFAQTILSFGRTSYYSPLHLPKPVDHYNVSLFRFDESVFKSTIVVTVTPRYNPEYKPVIGAWAGNWQNGLGAGDVAWGTKEELINYASKTAPELKELSYVKSLKVVSKGLFVAQAVVSGAQATDAWVNDDSNKWGVTAKAALDITMGYIGLVGGPVGWIISGTYYVADAAGAFDSWSKPANAQK